MSVKAGVWIDHRHAVLVLLTDKGHDIQKFTSDIEDAGRPTLKNAHTSHDLVPEDKLERKFDSNLKDFYDEVITALGGLETLLILGPGEAKGEFHKRLDSKNLSGLHVEVQAADKMSDGQLIAKVVQHFSVVAPVALK
ncbi:MAG: hypothetical protein JWN70_7003 [Planctomycetaceae bacterium]|nr:hypothetical protein [Planctomycetaceae bacterium]